MMPVRRSKLVRDRHLVATLDIDREYRKGIHALETLRLRRAKIMEAGFGVCNNLGLSVFDH
jgi:hypothetical protein